MTTTTDLGFVHAHRPAAPRDALVTVLALHGTGGDERDLLPLVATVAPGAGVLSPRGKVLEHGMPRFFRRHAEGVLDEDDVRRAAVELADFVTAAAARYGFDPARVVALGYSNGANAAAAMMLLRPESLAGAALLRPMVPLTGVAPPRLDGVPVLIAAGRFDPMVPGAQSERLAALLREGGADVTLRWADAAHPLAVDEVRAVGAWFGERWGGGVG